VVHPSDPSGIVLITQLDPISVLFALPQDQLPEVAVQLAKRPLAVEAWSRDSRTRLGDGRLQLVDNQINQATASIRLKSIFANPRHLLWPNQFVKARLLVTTARGALVIPAVAVQRGPEGSFVYVIGADATVSARPVEVASTQDELALIRAGLAPGEEVVTEGQNQLRSGSRVARRPAAKTAELQ
jgi:multidrug efflux system membrane fusion protein